MQLQKRLSFHKTLELNHKPIKVFVHKNTHSVTTERFEEPSHTHGVISFDTSSVLLLYRKNRESGGKGSASDTQQPVFTVPVFL